MTGLLSKNKTKLLKFFFSHPEQQFYMQEIGRRMGNKPGVFQRTLYDLEKQGILKSEYKANARYFMVNKGYPLYKELKNIVFKTDKL